MDHRWNGQQKTYNYQINIWRPTCNTSRKEILQEMLEFLSTYYPYLSFHLRFNNTRELTSDERKSVWQEAYSNHLGEKNTIERARRIGHWNHMDSDIKEFLKKCPIWQLQKTTGIKNQAEAIIPNITLKPNDKIALDIFGPLPETSRGNKYILSSQDCLTRYTILVPMVHETTQWILEGLIEHYIYVFGTRKNILSDHFITIRIDHWQRTKYTI